MAAKTVELAGVGTVTMHKRKATKSIRLSIRPDGSVRLTLPYWVPYKAALEFALSKKDWIAINKPAKPNLIANMARVGKKHYIYFVRGQGDAVATRVGKEVITVQLPAGISYLDEEAQEAARKAALRALKKEVLDILAPRVKIFARQHGFRCNSVKAKQLTSRWGSCDAHANITLSLYLMQVPWELIDYVIFHELTHTAHLNHGPDFWAALEQFVPDAKARRRAIKLHRPALAVK
jgi:predicted metal-dependent hydrolase